MSKITHEIICDVTSQEEFDAILNWDRTAIILDDPLFTYINSDGVYLAVGDELILKERYKDELTGREQYGLVRDIQFWDTPGLGLEEGKILVSLDYSYYGYKLLYDNYNHR